MLDVSIEYKNSYLIKPFFILFTLASNKLRHNNKESLCFRLEV